MAKPSLCIVVLGMRAKLDISLKKTFARFCDKRTDAHRGTDRHEDLDKRLLGHQKTAYELMIIETCCRSICRIKHLISLKDTPDCESIVVASFFVVKQALCLV